MGSILDISGRCQPRMFIVVVSWPAGAIVSAIELDSNAAHSANVKGAAQAMTRQSEMANTSPCHSPPLKSKILIIFPLRHFLCSLEFLYF